MSLLTTVTETADTQAVDLDVSSLWAPSFPSADLVHAARGLFTPLRKWDGSEGARARLIIGPGVIQVSQRDPAKHDRAHERRESTRRKTQDLRALDLGLGRKVVEQEGVVDGVALLAGAGLVEWDHLEREGDWLDFLNGRVDQVAAAEDAPPGRSKITTWSAKSRARMVRVLLGLDYAPLYETGETPAMLTLTYPGEWLAVAPTAAISVAHVKAFKKRFRRAWGRDLVGVWKREFQRRGAPHYHVLMTPPTGRVNGEDFRTWSSRVWAEIVDAQRCSSGGEPHSAGCCEFGRHLAAGVGVDYREGVRYQDPRRLAVYFSKHGSFASKDYQNDAPEEWVAAGSVGRFWGVWGLDVAAGVVEVTQVEALAAARTMRRWQRANGFRAQGTVWRTDTRTGVMRKRRSGRWVGSRMRGHLGFVAVNDGPGFASRLATYLDQVREDAQRRELRALGASVWALDQAGI